MDSTLHEPCSFVVVVVREVGCGWVGGQWCWVERSG